GAPERGHTERIVETDWNVSGQGLPARFDVAGPNPAAKPGDTGVAVAVETPGTNVWAIQERPLIVAAMACQAGFDGEFVAVVGPPAVHAQGEGLAMAGPIVTDVEWGGKVFGLMNR